MSSPALPVLPLEQVERSREWVAAKRPGNPLKHKVEYWERLGLIPESAKETRLVAITRSNNRELVRPVTFYSVKTLEALASKDWSASRRDKAKAFRIAQECKVIDGVKHWRIGLAAAYLGMTRAGLHGSDLPRIEIKTARRLTSYFPVPAIEAAKVKQESVSQLGEAEVSLKEAVIRTSRSAWTLRDPVWCRENEIQQIRITCNRHGRNEPYVSFRFEAANLDDFILRRAAVVGPWKLPADIVDAARARQTMRATNEAATDAPLRPDPALPDPPSAAKPGRRGRRKSEITQTVYADCYDLMAKGWDRRVIIKMLATKYPNPDWESSLPKQLCDVSKYASRHAKNPDNPKPWPIPGLRA
jgi:hypothetical protein